MSGHNDMRYKYYRICFGVCMQFCDALIASCAIGIHEPKWTTHVKRPSDVAQSYTSSDITESYVYSGSNKMVFSSSLPLLLSS